jgi:hypothetical protein
MGSITMETTAYRPSRESRAFGSDRSASHPSTASYIRAHAERADLSHDDPVPLFLSDPLGAPDPREYAPRELRLGSRLVPRILAGVLAISTMAVLVAIFQPDLRGLVTANAGGATSIAADQPLAPASTPIARQVPIKDPARVTNTRLASADAQDLPAPSTPSREAIATAYQIALQAQAPVTAPVPVAVQPAPPQPAPPQPARALDADTLAGLMTRAKSLIGVGDIAAARLLLERAANAQDATAALLLAQTYDPAVLGTRDSRSVTADATAARDWYQRAAAFGSAEAQQRLAQLSN